MADAKGWTFTLKPWLDLDVLVHECTVDAELGARGGWMVKVINHTVNSETGEPGTFGNETWHSRAPRSRQEAARWAIEGVVRQLGHEALEFLRVDGGERCFRPHQVKAHNAGAKVEWP